MKTMKSLYFDYAATTPVDPRVLKAMLPYFSEEFGNPGSLHSLGQKTSAAIFNARQIIAKAIGAHYSEIIFTGSATEANNLAIRGAVAYFKKKNPGVRPRILIPEIEHDCVLRTVKGVAEYGTEVIYIPVSKEGIVDIEAIKKNLNERTVIVSVMYANNEIGTIQPIAEIAKIIYDFRERYASRDTRGGPWPLFHTDAVQAFEYLSCDVASLGVDMMTLSAHKMYGPKGIGALYIKNRQLVSRKIFKSYEDRYLIRPIIVGGGQEEGLRSGTENVPAIVGFAAAVTFASQTREKEKKRLKALRDTFLAKLRKAWSGIKINGSMKQRLPNHINIYVPGHTAEQILIAFDLMGIIISSGSACSARSPEPSKVLLALGASKERAKNSVRITFGRPTDRKSIDILLAAFLKLKKK